MSSSVSAVPLFQLPIEVYLDPLEATARRELSPLAVRLCIPLIALLRPVSFTFLSPTHTTMFLFLLKHNISAVPTVNECFGSCQVSFVCIGHLVQILSVSHCLDKFAAPRRDRRLRNTT